MEGCPRSARAGYGKHPANEVTDHYAFSNNWREWSRVRADFVKLTA
jgi:hypothetical protein